MPREECVARFINHGHARKGKDNLYAICRLREIGDKVPRLVFYAKRDIAAGEQLFFDYGDRDAKHLKDHPWLKMNPEKS